MESVKLAKTATPLVMPHGSAAIAAQMRRLNIKESFLQNGEWLAERIIQSLKTFRKTEYNVENIAFTSFCSARIWCE
jgi:hypothetical protein